MVIIFRSSPDFRNCLRESFQTSLLLWNPVATPVFHDDLENITTDYHMLPYDYREEIVFSIISYELKREQINAPNVGNPTTISFDMRYLNICLCYRSIWQLLHTTLMRLKLALPNLKRNRKRNSGDILISWYIIFMKSINLKYVVKIPIMRRCDKSADGRDADNSAVLHCIEIRNRIHLNIYGV